MGYKNTCSEIDSIAQDIVSRQPGLILLETRVWILPVTVITVGFTLGGYRRFNLIEEFVMKCIASGLTELKTPQGITGLLRLEAVFIEKCLNELLQRRLLAQSDVAGELLYELTDTGRETYRTGLIPVPPGQETVSITLNSQYELRTACRQRLDKVDFPGLDWPAFRYYNRQEEQTLRRDFLPSSTEAARIAQGQMAGWYGGNWAETVTEQQEPRFEEDRPHPFGEVWIYNAALNQVFCHVWDFERQTFCEKLAAALNSLEAGHQLAQVEAVFHQAAHYQKLLELFGTQRRQENPVPYRLETLYGQFDMFFQQACDDVHKVMLLTVPGIAEIAARKESLELLRDIVSRQGVVFIGWGTDGPMGKDSVPEQEAALDMMKSIVNADGLPGVFLFELGDLSHHEAVIDRQYCLLDLLPWVSYQDEAVICNQSVVRIFAESFVAEQSACLQGLFLKQLEQQLVNGHFLNEDNCISWFCALLRLQDHGYIREMLAEEAVAGVIATQPGAILLKLLTVYIKAGEFEFGFDRLLAWLMHQGDNAGAAQWLEELYMENPAMYRKITTLCRTK